ncbi:MAG: hypothetical protein C4575_06675 [Desulforudis sp.]|jgi:hypothetical protein|nr:MAG: hypothetical protein C4575_06675 [Desulforudis sp.]
MVKIIQFFLVLLLIVNSNLTYAASEIVVQVRLLEKAAYVFLEEVDGVRSSKWNPNGKFKVKASEPVEIDGKYVYIINVVHPGSPKVINVVGATYKSGDVSRSKDYRLNLPLIQKRQIDINGTSFYDVMYASYSE